VKGFVTRNAFYKNMKDTLYVPTNMTLKKRFIGFKLSRIGKKQFDQMSKERQGILNMIAKVDKNI